MINQLIIVFTRNPELGKCKTRLAASIGDKNALKVYRLLLQHTAKTIQKVKVDTVVFYTKKIQEDDIWPDVYFQKQIQVQGHLGEKMKAAFEWGFKQGYQKICIVGSDLLELESADLIKAFDHLDSCDLVFGPAQDGGYYLMGMKQLHKEAFLNKKWSTASVLKKTLDDLHQKTVSLLEIKNDIDTVEDLVKYKDFRRYIPQDILSKHT